MSFRELRTSNDVEKVKIFNKNLSIFRMAATLVVQPLDLVKNRMQVIILNHRIVWIVLSFTITLDLPENLNLKH